MIRTRALPHRKAISFQLSAVSDFVLGTLFHAVAFALRVTVNRNWKPTPPRVVKSQAQMQRETEEAARFWMGL